LGIAAISQFGILGNDDGDGSHSGAHQGGSHQGGGGIVSKNVSDGNS
jgi:hypothetical protein